MSTSSERGEDADLCVPSAARNIVRKYPVFSLVGISLGLQINVAGMRLSGEIPLSVISCRECLAGCAKRLRRKQH
jgi:hypothetical protein